MGGETPFRDLLAYAIGGGWGTEQPVEGSMPVRVIRGTDFANILAGLIHAVPRRYESRSSAERRILRPNDILLEISGGSKASGQTTGRTLFVTRELLERLGEPTIPASFCRLVRLKDNVVDPCYAFYVLQEMYRSGRAGLYENQSTGISNFQFEFFLDNETVRLPSLPEQRAIAHILGTLDDKIELSRRMNETLEAMARALFKSWFVDFDPVRAKMEGCWRRGESLPGLPAHLYDLFPDRLVDSELGEMPEGWEARVLDDLKSEALGGDWGVDSPSGDSSMPARCIRGADIPDLQMGGSGKMPLRYLKAASLEKRKLGPGDLVVEISGGSPTQSTGRVVLISQQLLRRLDAPLVCSNFCRFVRPTSPIYSAPLYLWLRHLYTNDELYQFETGTTGIKNFAFTLFSARHAFCVPSDEVLAQFDVLVEPFLARRHVSASDTEFLAAVRDALLPKLISGELRVEDAGRIMEEATR
jgi:type I restriction enzyme S subunit